MGSSAPPPSKEACRTRFRTYRHSLSERRQQARSALIAHRVLQHPVLASAQTVQLYWPQLEQGEVDTRLLIAALRVRGATIALPVVTGYEPEHPTMEPRRYGGVGGLTTNRWDIREPADGPRIPPEALDAVIVPALGADRNGHRIGHGAGYYDAFLSAVQVPRIGLVYHECLLPSVPSAAHDVALTSIITERGTFAVD